MTYKISREQAEMARDLHAKGYSWIKISRAMGLAKRSITHAAEHADRYPMFGVSASVDYELLGEPRYGKGGATKGLGIRRDPATNQRSSLRAIAQNHGINFHRLHRLVYVKQMPLDKALEAAKGVA